MNVTSLKAIMALGFGGTDSGPSEDSKDSPAPSADFSTVGEEDSSGVAWVTTVSDCMTSWASSRVTTFLGVVSLSGLQTNLNGDVVPLHESTKNSLRCVTCHCITRGQWPYIPASTWAIKVCLNFGSLWGHYSLRTASYIKFNLIFEISDPNYLLIHMHIVFIVWVLLAASEATTA